MYRGPKAKYPPLSQILIETLVLLRGPLLLALFIVGVVNHPSMLPALLLALRRSQPLDDFVGWLATTLPMNGRNPWDVFLLVAGTNIVHTVCYITVNGSTMLFDKLGWFKQYKLPRTPAMAVSSSLFWRTIAEAAFNQILLSPLVMYLLAIYVARFPSFFEADGITPAQAPELWPTFLHCVAATCWNETFLYVTHRLFHEIPFLYKHVHKQHHQYPGTIGIAAEYGHPVEVLFMNQFPTAGYCILFSSLIAPSMWISWVGCRASEAFETHSGYCFKGSLLHKMGLTNSRRSEFHDFHHSVNQGNYGCVFTDYVGGTMDAWILHEEKLRVAALAKGTGPR